MKISLVVASGVHEGKVIAVPGAQLIIGRDEGCHLRPASPAISKRHCAVFIRDGQGFIRDLGSTNGTFVNDEPVVGDRPVNTGDRLRIGPLDFTLNLLSSGKSDSTPLPDELKSKSAVVAKPGATPPPLKPATTKPASKSEIAIKPAAKSDPALKPEPTKLSPKSDFAVKPTGQSAADAEQDNIAAMLLGMGDEDPPGSDPKVPEGSTVMDMPAVDGAAKPDDKKKGVPTAAESSAAASDILRKYMRRPK